MTVGGGLHRAIGAANVVCEMSRVMSERYAPIRHALADCLRPPPSKARSAQSEIGVRFDAAIHLMLSLLDSVALSKARG